MKLPRFAALLSLLALTGCAYLPTGSLERIQSEAPKNRPAQVASAERPRVTYQKGPGFVDPKTQPYSIKGITYWPIQSGLGYNEVGTASWYGIDFHGKKTATGEVYDMFGVSAAHKTLPLGTKVRVTNLENGRELEMTVNDRGPFIDGRIIDLSYASARLLGMADNGVAKVRVTGIGDNPAIATATVKTGALASAEVPAGRQKTQIIEKNIVEEPARPQPKAERPVQVAEAAKPRPAVAQVTAAAKPAPKVEQRAESGKYSVQVGAFSQDDNARRVQKKLVQAGYDSAKITRVMRDGKELMAVQAGAFEQREKAEEALRILKMEFPASFISSGA
jgi:rare lipoprotein A